MYCIKSHIHFQVSPSTSEIFNKNWKSGVFTPVYPIVRTAQWFCLVQRFLWFCCCGCAIYWWLYWTQQSLTKQVKGVTPVTSFVGINMSQREGIIRFCKPIFNNIKFWVQKLGTIGQLIYSVRLPHGATTWEKFVAACDYCTTGVSEDHAKCAHKWSFWGSRALKLHWRSFWGSHALIFR